MHSIHKCSYLSATKNVTGAELKKIDSPMWGILYIHFIYPTDNNCNVTRQLSYDHDCSVKQLLANDHDCSITRQLPTIYDYSVRRLFHNDHDC